jgi:hypothetical protein
MAVHPAVLCHDEVGHFIHPMSHKRNLEVTPTYVVRSFVVCKKRIRSLKRHAKISAKIRGSEIASSSWRCNRLASDQILCQKVLKWLAIDSSKHSWSDISDIEQYGRSEYSISVRSRHIRPPPPLSLSLFAWKKLYRRLHTHGDANQQILVSSTNIEVSEISSVSLVKFLPNFLYCDVKQKII